MTNPLTRLNMGNLLKDNKVIIHSNKQVNTTEKVENLTNNEVGIIKSLINKDREVVESQTSNVVLTLEEMANKIKNNR